MSKTFDHPTYSDHPINAGTYEDQDGLQHNCLGLTKREYFAAMALQGLAAKGWFDDELITQRAKAAVKYADVLIEALNGNTNE